MRKSAQIVFMVVAFAASAVTTCALLGWAIDRIAFTIEQLDSGREDCRCSSF